MRSLVERALLKRLDALESSPERKSSRKVDDAALPELERAAAPEERKQAKQLATLIETTVAPDVSTRSTNA